MSNMTNSSADAARPVLLPDKGMARVKKVTSGDTLILGGRTQTPGSIPPEVQFTLEGLMAPRMASKNYPTEDPGAFPAREFLRNMLVGKVVSFSTIRRKPLTANMKNDSPTQYHHYGHIHFNNSNVAVEVVQNGHSKVKDDLLSNASKNDAGEGKEADRTAEEYRTQVAQAYKKAKDGATGMHAPAPQVRELRDLKEDSLNAFVQKVLNKKVWCVIEYIFDGSRSRCQIVDSDVPGEYMNASFTLLLAGVISPRCGRPNDASSKSEEFGDKARLFVEERLLQRKLQLTFHGTDKNSMGAIATVHHPKGSIAVNLLQKGYARMSDWSVRMMKPTDIPELRTAENAAKQSKTGVWHSYTPPTLSGPSEIIGTVIEVQSGDTIIILPNGTEYTSEDALEKVSLASIRAPRLGNERAGRADEPFAAECRERLRGLLIGKAVKAQIHYEREIPYGSGATETRRFGTVSVGKKSDVGILLLSEGLAISQRHRDDDPKSANYDSLLISEGKAKDTKKGMHALGEYKKASVNDLTDPKKATAYAGTLISRSGSVKAIVEYIFNGSRFKLFIPAENCTIMFAPSAVRCPQPSPMGSRKGGRAAEPFGDVSKRFAKMRILQRNVEISCSDITKGGIITGSLNFWQGAQRRDYSVDLVGAGLAKIDQFKIDYGEVAQYLVDAQTVAEKKKAGLWSLEKKEEVKKEGKTVEKVVTEKTLNIKLSEIRDGSNFYFTVVDDESIKVIEDSMKLFTDSNGTKGAECEVKLGKIVAALFDDGSGKSWYRAKVLERKENDEVSVLFIDHGNVTTLKSTTHLRPLDESLDIDKIPAVAKEGVLAMTVTRALNTDEGVDAARMLQDVAWGKDLTAKMLTSSEMILMYPGKETSINEEIVGVGLARVSKPMEVKALARSAKRADEVLTLAKSLNKLAEEAKKSRSGMWRYGDIGDEDEAERNF